MPYIPEEVSIPEVVRADKLYPRNEKTKKTALSQIAVDNEFNNIMTEEVKVIIAKAFISLEAGLRRGKLWSGFSGTEIELVERKASQMKKEVNDFIDSQKQRIIAASEARWHNGSQVPE